MASRSVQLTSSILHSCLREGLSLNEGIILRTQTRISRCCIKSSPSGKHILLTCFLSVKVNPSILPRDEHGEWEARWGGGSDRQEKLCHSFSSACLSQQTSSSVFHFAAWLCRCECVCVRALRATHSSLLTRPLLQTAEEAHLTACCIPGEVLWPGQGERGNSGEEKRGFLGQAAASHSAKRIL